MNFTILRFDSIGSTNTEAAAQARSGAAEGVCVIAYEQTEGRGRRGRKWISERGAGLYFSVILRPSLEVQLLPLVTLMTGVAVHDAVQQFGVKPDIKWVNDVLAHEKKIAGILAETIETRTGTAIVVGIGINLRSNFPGEEVAQTATSVERETGLVVSPDHAAEFLTSYFSKFYELLSGPDGGNEIIGHWRERSSYFRGKEVRVTLSDDTFEGITDGLEPNGALRVRKADGSITVVQAGDVERLRKTELSQAWI